ncbi:MAG: 3-deoxy-D-manno-octulosonic acid transferase, partial [Bacteroidia bacterium]|nr:3-deoxy-D-manno-octulosonic acid transferase [Bacteroidia bacterium]
MAIIYNGLMSLYLFASKISGSFSPKAQKFYKSRRNLLKQIKEETKDTASVSKGNRYWFHCASAGEFEQARPLIESIKENTPSAFIVVTFFSPSGYELRKDYSLANHVFYLPMDNSSNVRQFLDCIRPDHAIFIKYEFWYNYLKNLNKRGIPVYLVSANFMKTQPFFKWWGFFFRRMLRYFTHIFVQDVGSEELLAEIGISNVSVAGDTRFDRVSKVAQSK